MLARKIKNALTINKILIVDDDKSILQTMSKALRKVCNFRGEIKTVKYGKDAIEEISNCFYNICFLDIKLPDLNGLDIMKRMKEISPETKIAIMTGRPITADMKMAIEEGASLFLEKPFDVSQIKTFVRQALASQQSGLNERLHISCFSLIL